MKVRAQTAAALAIAGVSAQTPGSGSAGTTSPPVSYTTITYDDCPTADIATMITVTNGITVTYCPECEHETSPPIPTTKKPGHTTVYTTTYLSLCPTGTVPVTYTVTETCEEETPTWTPGPDHVPQGFTVTVKQCSACKGGEKTPIPVTITEPCDCEATSGTPIGPKPTGDKPGPQPTGKPIEQIPDGQVQNPGPPGKPIEQIPDGQVQNPGPPGKPIEQIPDGQVQNPGPPGKPIEQIPDGQVQNPGPPGKPIEQIPDGQVQNPGPPGKPIEQIPDGQVQNPGPPGKPIEQIPDGQVQNPGPPGKPIQQIPDGQVQNPGRPEGGHVPSAPGLNSGTAPPYPTGATSTLKCPGPDCQAHATGGGAGPAGGAAPADSATPPADGSSTPGGPAPYKGSASRAPAGAFMTVSLVIAALAFAL